MNQTLTRKQFDILSILAEEKGTLSQRQLGEKSGHSLGTVNRVMQELTELHDGLSSILITEFFIGRCWDRVNCMELHIPIASGSEGNRLSNTR